jgi:hypothetical protein
MNRDSWGLRVQDHKEKSDNELMYDPLTEILAETPPNHRTWKSTENAFENRIKEKPMGLKDLTQD